MGDFLSIQVSLGHHRDNSHNFGTVQDIPGQLATTDNCFHTFCISLDSSELHADGPGCCFTRHHLIAHLNRASIFTDIVERLLQTNSDWYSCMHSTQSSKVPIYPTHNSVTHAQVYNQVHVCNLASSSQCAVNATTPEIIILRWLPQHQGHRSRTQTTPGIIVG